MNADVTFHYPPDLFNLLVESLPLLNKSKRDMLLFFEGAGVPSRILADLHQRLVSDRKNLSKYEIARTVLQRLNEGDEQALRERREVLRRVVQFTNFDACWPDDRLKARGAVAGVRAIVNEKDAFTRMNQAREEERQSRRSVEQKQRREKRKRAAKIAAAKQELFVLFGADVTPQKRGKALEGTLHRLFLAFDIAVHEAFHLVGEDGVGIVEQVDGVIELRGSVYFVEAKWHGRPVGKAEVSEHLVRLMSRDQAGGLIISASGFTGAAIQTCHEFLQHKLVVLCHLQELVWVLERERELADFLNEKVQAAVIHRNPYFKPLDASADG